METNWLILILFIVGFFVLVVVLQMLSNRVAESNRKTLPGEQSTAQTAEQTGVDVGKDIVKTTLIWTVSSMLVGFFRSMIQPKK
jgi:predicted secreted protein